MGTSRVQVAIAGVFVLGALVAGPFLASRGNAPSWLGGGLFSQQPAPVGPSGEWTLKFQDEFDGSAVDWSTWADHSSAEADSGHGNKANDQLEWNQGENCSVADGLLTITAKPADITSPSGTHYDWSSCLLTSTPSLSFRYGFMQIRAKLPANKGFWPAFWTWQAPGSDRWTETDVFEYHSSDPGRLRLTQHSGAGGECSVTPGFDPAKGFHTYGADIEPSGTSFYLDGDLVCRAPGTPSGPTNLVIDQFVHAKAPPAPDSVGVTQVAYVRVWTRAH